MTMKHFTAFCDLHSADCFYLNNAQLYPDCQTCCMDDPTLKLYIRQKIEVCGTNKVYFSWQDSELTPDTLTFLHALSRYNSALRKVKKLLISCLSAILF
jgi:uncharacterized protein